MTPKFTTPCYVRIEDKDKRKKVCEQLDKLEYWCACVGRLIDDFVITHDAEYLVDYRLTDEDIGVDCGTNTECFLALAGMRNDTDRNQWFKLKDDYSHLAKRFFLNIFLFPYDDFYIDARRFYRRATTTEIIEYFKKQIIMTPNELRIGNWVLHEDYSTEMFKVKDIKQHL